MLGILFIYYDVQMTFNLISEDNFIVIERYVTPCIPTENFYTKPIEAEMPKGAEKTLQSESANRKEVR